MIFDKEKLLSIYDQTKDAEPMRTQRRRNRPRTGHGLRRKACTSSRMTDSQRILPLATLLGAVGMWLMLPRGAARRPRGGRRAGRGRAGAWGSRRLPGLGDLAGRGHVLRAGGRDRRCRRWRRSPSATRSTAPSGSACRCWARPACSSSAGPSSWPWPPWWSMPGRSWSRSCSCSCWPSPRTRLYDRVSWEAAAFGGHGRGAGRRAVDDAGRVARGRRRQAGRSSPLTAAGRALWPATPDAAARRPLGRRNCSAGT